jgi:hypothetical protein
MGDVAGSGSAEIWIDDAETHGRYPDRLNRCAAAPHAKDALSRARWRYDSNFQRTALLGKPGVFGGQC